MSRDGKLRVVIVGDHASVTGGLAKVALDSAIGLKTAGCEPIVFTAVAPVDPRLAAAGIETICLGQQDLLGHGSKVTAALQGVWNAHAAQALETLLARLPRENTLIHVHGWAKALSGAIAGPIRRSGLPRVFTMHDYFLHCPNGGFFDHQLGETCHLAPMSRDCWARNCDSRNYPVKLWRNVRQLITQKIARLEQAFDDFILLSDLQRDMLAPYLPHGARLHRLRNPIEAERLGPREKLGRQGAAPGDLLFVGRLSPEKGVMLFAEAARRVGVTPVFIGDGPAAAELAQAYPEARLLGWRSSAEVRAALRGARALVFPSLWAETQGMSALEAMAMGAPAIVSDGCAAREWVENGVSGLWFKSGDAESLAAALREMANDERVASLSRGAYEAYWRDPPTPEAHVADLLAIYHKIIEAGRRLESA
jgi:glycosyltransferase involved in cell wall biosynthesis